MYKPSGTLIPDTVQNVYPKGSESYRATASGLDEWPAVITLIQAHFYEKLDPPTSKEEALMNQKIHEHCHRDFEIQIDIIDIQLARLVPTGNNPAPSGFPFKNEFSDVNKLNELRERRHRLMASQRFHHNAQMIYWYCSQYM